MKEEIGLVATHSDERALVLVRSSGTHNARVLRGARTLLDLGYAPTIVAVVSDHERARRSTEQGIPIVRLAPTSPLAWIRSRLPGASAVAEEDAGLDVTSPPAGAEVPRRYPVVAVRFHRWLRTLDFYRRAIRLVLSVRPALIHCNDYNTMWVGVAARLLTRAGVVYDAHELWPDRNLRPEPRWWLLGCEFLFVRFAHRTITASPGYAEVMARRYRIRPPQVIRNIPDLPEPAGPAEAEDRPPTAAGKAAEPIALYVGAVTRNRGLEVSIRALALVPGLRLKLLGPASTSYRRELEALVRSAGVADRVEFAAPVSPDEVVDSIREATVGLALIQPICLSYRMSLPNKLFEYIAAGVPVLGSDLPVIGRFVSEHRIGLVARADDPADVAEKLREFVSPERRSAFGPALSAARMQMRWESEARLLAETYDDVAATRQRPHEYR